MRRRRRGGGGGVDELSGVTAGTAEFNDHRLAVDFFSVHLLKGFGRVSHIEELDELLVLLRRRFSQLLYGTFVCAYINIYIYYLYTNIPTNMRKY